MQWTWEKIGVLVAIAASVGGFLMSAGASQEQLASLNAKAQGIERRVERLEADAKTTHEMRGQFRALESLVNEMRNRR